jgi:hypothetical protein
VNEPFKKTSFLVQSSRSPSKTQFMGNGDIIPHSRCGKALNALLCVLSFLQKRRMSFAGYLDINQTKYQPPNGIAEESKELWSIDSPPSKLTASTAKSNSPSPKSECVITSDGFGAEGISVRKFHAPYKCCRQYMRYLDTAIGGKGNCTAGGSHSNFIVAEETLIGTQPLDGKGHPFTQRRETQMRLSVSALATYPRVYLLLSFLMKSQPTYCNIASFK